MGLARAQEQARAVLVQALQALDASGLAQTGALRSLAEMVVNRSR
jgi:farnesyl diphosphate synthase